MRLTQLRSFHAVARAGGFTGGAKLLHISQPTVTTQVRFLEETYGIELFYRRGHKVSLTPLGEQLYAMAQKIFASKRDDPFAGGLRRAQVRPAARGRRSDPST
jgi:DNA-binding transcriptional LysR family regulator